MELIRHNDTNTSVTALAKMTFEDLETIKTQLETVRRRILLLQNVHSMLFRLPGELRNKIFLLAMYGELEDRRRNRKHATMFREPAFFNASRQMKIECTGTWFTDVLVWEEFDSSARLWKQLSAEEVRAMSLAKSEVGKLTLVTQQAHCDLRRTRENVEGSCSICPRKGLIRADGDIGLPQLRWWVW